MPVVSEAEKQVARYGALIEATGSIVWTNSPKGEMRGPQPGWCAYTGQSEADVQGYGWAAAVHPDDVQPTIDAWQRAVATRTMYVFEHRVRRHDGAFRWFSTRGVPVLETDGSIREWVGIHRDIDDERRAQERLSGALDRLGASERHFRQLAEQLPNFVWTSLADGAVDWASPQMLEYLQLELPQMSSGAWVGTLHPDDRERIAAAWSRAIADGTPYEAELREGPATGGVYRAFLARANPVRDETGCIIKWLGSLTDVEAANQLQEELKQRDREREHLLALERESRERLQAALDGSDAGTFRWNIVTNALEWDENLDRLFGLEADATIHSLDKFVETLHPDDRAGVIERCRRCASDGADFDMEFRVVWPDGSVRWLDDKGKTYFDADGRPAYMTGMCRDITERKSIEGALRDVLEKLRASEEALRENDRRKDEFLATLAHELRNPLAPIRNGVELLKRQDGERSSRVSTMIDRQLRHMVRLVDDLLDISRISRGKIELSRERMTLESLFEHAIETSRPVIDGAAHTLTVTLPANPVWLDGDTTRLAQSISNLLNNAAKYTPAGGRIQLVGGVDGDRVVIRVSDNGVGIAKESRPALFSLFSQGTSGRERVQGGLGIGLSLVKRLVEMHDGSVTAASDGVDRGSTFIISLPLAPAPAAPATAVARRASAAARRVLVVDDNVDSAETLALLLELHGHDVATAHDGFAAVETIRKRPPEIVFLDIGMPGMDGFAVAEAVRADASIAQPVLVAMTGWGADSDRQRTRAAGFDHHLTKPVDVRVVDNLLEKIPAAAAVCSPAHSSPGGR